MQFDDEFNANIVKTPALWFIESIVQGILRRM